ncbi:MAG: glycosyltransferase [Candidatus Goldiibacteriota bacterium]
MKKADLHVHSKHSDHPSEWFLKKLGTAESYTDPDYIYKTSIENGMDFATITDHNKIEGSLYLAEKYPDRAFSGVEATTYFPEDGCKIHINIFDIDKAAFAEIDSLRADIYKLRDYIKNKNLCYTVNHAPYSVNGRLTAAHLEKLILLFDVFESRNGARDANSNNTWTKILSSLTEEDILKLFQKHNIEPISSDPWIKGFTGGSDDHAGLFMGKTYTQSYADSKADFINNIKNKKTMVFGRHNSYQSFVFSIYKIAYDFSKSKGRNPSKNLFNSITELIFEKENLTFKDKLKINHFKKKAKENKNKINALLIELVEEAGKNSGSSIEEIPDILYSKISVLADEFLKLLFCSLEDDIYSGNISGIIKNISSAIPGIFLSIPFFSTLKHFYNNRAILKGLADEYCPEEILNSKRILWFTDTIKDLNGVSVTLRSIARFSHQSGKELMIASCLDEKDAGADLPPNIMNLPFIHSFKLPYYENYGLKLPSVLSSIKMISDFNPDEIYISTPGPVGFMGLLAAKVLNIKTAGIYHTDFAMQSKDIINEESVEKITESGIKWFYSVMDEIQVPTREYISILETRGFELPKMKVFRRGIDTSLFYPRSGEKNHAKNVFGIKDGPSLLYTGRVSKDKNLDFLLHIYRETSKKMPGINLIIAGDGPYLGELKENASSDKNIFFLGKQNQKIMPFIYSLADLLLFPSVTDTFGMTVLEAQACGIPAVVSDTGGPKEIIIHGETGLAARSNDADDWISKTLYLLKLCASDSCTYRRMSEKASKNIFENYNWNIVIDNITRKKNIPSCQKYHFGSKTVYGA